MTKSPATIAIAKAEKLLAFANTNSQVVDAMNLLARARRARMAELA